MVLEHAVISVRSGTGPQFEAAMEEARAVIAASPGFVSLELRRGVENPGRYLLLVEWDDLDAHLVGFRGSAAFTRWRELIGGFFDGQPQVDHYERFDNGS
jgi:heme-degrading monooxygenase HmoA